MKPRPLPEPELELLRSVLRRHPEVSLVTLFGFRAKGTHSPHADVDLAISGTVDPLKASAIEAELEDLPLPHRFEVQPLDGIRNPDLLDHIRRVGIAISPD